MKYEHLEETTQQVHQPDVVPVSALQWMQSQWVGTAQVMLSMSAIRIKRSFATQTANVSSWPVAVYCDATCRDVLKRLFPPESSECFGSFAD